MVYGLVGTIAAPLINRSAIRADFNTAKANQNIALYNYQESIINGYVEVYNQMANIRTLQAMNVVKQQELDVLNRAIGTSSELFKTGNANYLEILNTKRTALNAKFELIDTKKRQYNAVINIYKALGGGWKQNKNNQSE